MKSGASYNLVRGPRPFRHGRQRRGRVDPADHLDRVLALEGPRVVVDLVVRLLLLPRGLVAARARLVRVDLLLEARRVRVVGALADERRPQRLEQRQLGQVHAREAREARPGADDDGYVALDDAVCRPVGSAGLRWIGRRMAAMGGNSYLPAD